MKVWTIGIIEILSVIFIANIYLFWLLYRSFTLKLRRSWCLTFKIKIKILSHSNIQKRFRFDKICVDFVWYVIINGFVKARPLHAFYIVLGTNIRVTKQIFILCVLLLIGMSVYELNEGKQYSRHLYHSVICQYRTENRELISCNHGIN